MKYDLKWAIIVRDVQGTHNLKPITLSAVKVQNPHFTYHFIKFFKKKCIFTLLYTKNERI